LESDWNRKYREGSYPEAAAPHHLVTRFAPAFPRQRPIIDIAMGRGLDAVFLARSGLRVVGLEGSSTAIDLARHAARRSGTTIDTILGDARLLPFKDGIAGGVVVFYFLERQILGDLIRLLTPGGILLYETFLKRQATVGTGGPRNPDYLLDDGELFQRFSSLDLLFYEEGVFDSGGVQRAVARYAGRKR
jgi:tellurite methyltransferase